MTILTKHLEKNGYSLKGACFEHDSDGLSIEEFRNLGSELFLDNNQLELLDKSPVEGSLYLLVENKGVETLLKYDSNVKSWDLSKMISGSGKYEFEISKDFYGPGQGLEQIPKNTIIPTTRNSSYSKNLDLL